MGQASTANRNLGEILLREGLINEEQFNQGMREYELSERPLSRIFVEMGAITEGVKIGVLQKRCDCELVSLRDLSPRIDAVQLVPRPLCEKHHLVPLKTDKGRLLVAMEDPTDMRALRALETVSGMPIAPLLAKSAEIQDVISGLPEDKEIGETAPAHGLFYKIAKAVTLPIIWGLPVGIFVYAIYYVEGISDIWKEMDFDSFERVLFFLLAWSAWAIVAYWINDIIFGTSSEQEA
ncbi:hypothetical protein KQI84_05585 [bacterium]|nr:hypothetical protein [bacterium]